MDARHHRRDQSSVADFRAADANGVSIAPIATSLFAIPESVPVDIMPEDAGLILADAYGAIFCGKRKASHSPSHAPRVLMRLRACGGASPHRLSDPGGCAGRRRTSG